MYHCYCMINVLFRVRGINVTVFSGGCRRILTASSADEFYSLMGVLTQETMDGRIFNADLLVKVRTIKSYQQKGSIKFKLHTFKVF